LFLSRTCQSLFLRLAAILLVVLAWYSVTSCGKTNDATGGGNSGSRDILDAALRGDLREVKTLLQNNPNLVFSKDDGGMTPLHYVAFNGNNDVVELLLANHADVNTHESDFGWTPLHYAAYKGHPDAVESLLANHADVNATNHDGYTPLMWAVHEHHNDSAELLRQHGGHE
jgi:cytohesin